MPAAFFTGSFLSTIFISRWNWRMSLLLSWLLLKPSTNKQRIISRVVNRFFNISENVYLSCSLYLLSILSLVKYWKALTKISIDIYTVWHLTASAKFIIFHRFSKYYNFSILMTVRLYVSLSSALKSSSLIFLVHRNNEKWVTSGEWVNFTRHKF